MTLVVDLADYRGRRTITPPGADLWRRARSVLPHNSNYEVTAAPATGRFVSAQAPGNPLDAVIRRLEAVERAEDEHVATEFLTRYRHNTRSAYRRDLDDFLGYCAAVPWRRNRPVEEP